MHAKLCFLVLSLVSFTSVISKELPSYIPICKRNNPDFQSCLLKATVGIRPYISKGIKELNVPTTEPLTIPMIKLQQGTGAVNYKATLTNIKIFGLSNYHFRTFTTDLSKKFKMHGNVDLPRLMLEADYVIAGSLLVVPIQGNGVFTANITNCRADVEIHADQIRKKSKEYVHVKDSHVKLQFGGAMAHFANLFNGDEFLSRTTNEFLNMNAKDLLDEVKPAIEAVASMLVEDIAGKILSSVPADKLFPK